MCNRWILFTLSLIVLSNSAWQKLTAQQIVRPDSVVMLKDSRTGDVGFVMPKLIAIDYRNLVMITVPMMEEQIDSLKLNITKHKSIINNQHDEIDLLKINVDDAKKQLEAENNIRLACEQEQARMKKWKVYTYVLAAATLVTLGLYAGK